MSYKLTFQGNSAVSKFTGLVEINPTIANVSATSAAAGGSALSLTLTAPFSSLVNNPFPITYTYQYVISPNSSTGSLTDGTSGYTVTFTSGVNSGNSYPATFYAASGETLATGGIFYLSTPVASEPSMVDAYTITGPGITGSLTGHFGKSAQNHFYVTYTTPSAIPQLETGAGSVVIASGPSYGEALQTGCYCTALSNGIYLFSIAVSNGEVDLGSSLLGSSASFFLQDAFQQSGYPNSQWLMPPEIPAAVGLSGTWPGSLTVQTAFNQVIMNPPLGMTDGASYTVQFTSGPNSGNSYPAIYYALDGYLHITTLTASTPNLGDSVKITNFGPQGVGQPTYQIGEDSGGNYYWTYYLSTTLGPTGPITVYTSNGSPINSQFYALADSINFLTIQVPRSTTPDPTQGIGVFSAPTNFGGWLAFVSAFTTGTDSTGVTGVNWPQYIGLSNGGATLPLVAQQKIFNGITFNFLVTQTYDTSLAPLSMFGVEAISTGTIAGDLAIVQTFFNLIAQNYNICNNMVAVADQSVDSGNDNPAADVTSYQTVGPTIQSFPSNFSGSSWFTTSTSGNTLSITLNSQFPNAMGSITGNGGSPTYPYLLVGTASNVTQTGVDAVNYSVYGVENTLNDVVSGAVAPGAAAFAFLTGILYDAMGIPQTQPITTPGTVTSVVAKDKNHVYVDSATKAAMIAAGFAAGIDNINLTWMPSTATTTTAVTVGCANHSSQTTFLTTASRKALRANGLLPNEAATVTVTSGPNSGKTFTTQLTKWFKFQSSVSLTRGTTLNITTANPNYNNLNQGTWTGGRWSGSNNIITFDNVYLPHNCVPIVLNQSMTLSQLGDNSSGHYTIWLYDSTGLDANAVKVTGQLDLNPDRTDLFNPPPLVQLRVDNTYGYDSQSGQQLYPALLSNQQDYNTSQVLSSTSALLGLTLSLTAADNTAMWVAGFQPYSNTKTGRNQHVVTDSHGHNVTSIWDGQGTITLDSTPPNNFAAPFTITQKVRPDTHRIQMALDPSLYATGSLKIKYSGTINKTIDAQLITSPAAADSFVWFAPDETLEGVATTPALEIGLEGDGSATIQIPFTITSV